MMTSNAQGQHLVAVYDMMLALVGERDVGKLTEAFLQRLLYHTGFSCAVLLIHADDVPDVAAIEQAVGNRALRKLLGQRLAWPAELFTVEAGQVFKMQLPESLFDGAGRYKQALRLAVPELGCILLFSGGEVAADLDCGLAFSPVLDRFAKAYLTGRLIEEHANSLRQEVMERQQAQTQLQEKQRQLWAMLEFLPMAIAAFGLDGNTQYVNASFVDLFGFDKERAPSLDAWWHLASVDAGSYKQLSERWQASVAQAKLYQTDPEPISGMARCRGGELRYLEMRAVFVGDGLLAAVIDLTQRRELEQALNRAKEDVEREVSGKIQIVNRIARDLYSPLNVAMGYIQMLESDTQLPSQDVAYLGEVKAACEQMLAMIKQLAGTALTETTSHAVPEATSGDGKPGRILVVDDYEPNRQLLIRQLTRLGYAADIAGDGAEALRKWQAEPYALILTDCNMPVMDGVALAEHIREIERELGGRVPIVAASANTTKQEIDKCLNAGMDGFLNKPIKLDELERLCAEYLAPKQEPVVTVPAPTPVRPATPEYIAEGSRLRQLQSLLGDIEPRELFRLAEVFIASLRETLSDMEASERADDGAGLAMAAHKLKSSLRTIGEDQLLAQAGMIEYAAKADDWTTIRRELPALMADSLKSVEAIQVELNQRPASAAPDIGAIADAVEDWAHLKVMVVDDDSFVCQQVENMLHRLGVGKVSRASDGAEALAELDSHSGEIDVVLCDLNMPGMDGLEFIRHVAGRNYKPDIAFISGEDSRMLGSARDLAQAQGLHVLGVAVKPIRSTALYGILGRHGRQEALRTMARTGGPEITVADIAAGIEAGQFTAFFQPKVDAHSLEVMGLEALARWQHPEHGLIPPGLFIPLAEANGLIEGLTKSVFVKALEAGGELHRLGYKLKVAVNYSAQSFGSLGLPEFVVSSAKAAGLDPKYLIIEVTESGLMSDLTVALEVLGRLRLKGVNLSIDDFGTGYSSMDQLRRIPFSELKIDQSFVRGAARDPMARSILESSIEMARKLKLETVAEGVETEEDLEVVRGLGCGLVQGYLIARPLALPDLIEWLKQRPDH